MFTTLNKMTFDASSRRGRAIKNKNYKELFLNEEGAIDLASIMVGVIVIGIVAGVIAATVFSVIPWSQNQAASQKLGAVTNAESVQYAQSSSNSAATYATFANLTGTSNASGSSLVQSDPKVDAIISTNGAHFIAVSKSATGVFYYTTDENPTPVTTVPSTGDYASASFGTAIPTASPWK